jgi:hypothetical protein
MEGLEGHGVLGEGVECAMDRARKGPSKTEYKRLRADLERFFRQLGKAYSSGS